MIIHIYDAPPHGFWHPEHSDPEKHNDGKRGSYTHKCCCCSDICKYSLKRGKGWAKMFELFKSNKIKYQGLCTDIEDEYNVYFDNYMK